MSKASGDYTHLGVAFYLKPESSFASGQAPLDLLERNTLKEFPIIRAKYGQANITAQLSTDTFATALDLTHTIVKKGEVFFNLGRQGSFFKMMKKDQTITWFSRDELIPWDKDLGAAITLTPLKMGLAYYPALSRFQVMGFEGKEILVKNATGSLMRLPSSDVITKFDFVTAANCKMKNKDLKQEISWRENNDLILKNSQRVAIQDCRQFTNKNDLAIVVKSNSQQIPLRTRLTIKPDFMETWVQSELRGHGKVYWKKVSRNSLKISETTAKN